MNNVFGLTESQLLSCFILGVKPTLGRAVCLAKPTNLLEAFDLAKEFEARGEEVRHDRISFTRNLTCPPLVCLNYYQRYTLRLSSPEKFLMLIRGGNDCNDSA